MDVKGFVKNNLLQIVLAGAGIVLSLIAVILAVIVTKNDGSVDVAVVAVTVAAICVSVVTVFFDYKDFGKMAACGMYLCACILFVSSQFGNIGYAAAGITDIGNGIQPGFIAGTIMYVAALIAQAVAVFKKTKKEGE